MTLAVISGIWLVSVSGGTIDTPASAQYYAPEMYDGVYDESVDIYAFGLLLMELATLRRPYDECTTQVNAPPPPPVILWLWVVTKCTVGAVPDLGPKFSTQVESSILPANDSKLNPRRRSPSTEEPRKRSNPKSNFSYTISLQFPYTVCHTTQCCCARDVQRGSNFESASLWSAMTFE
jgi:hypothetical protein